MSLFTRACSLILLYSFATPGASAPPTLSYLTWFGNPAAIATDQAGNVYVAGSTSSSTFPLAGAFRSAIGEGNCSLMPSKTFSKCPEAFVAKLDPAGTRLIYSTYLGGYGRDFATSIAVDNAGNAYVAGVTDSGDFPGSDPAEKKFAPVRSFVVKLSPAGDLVYARLFPGMGGIQMFSGPGVSYPAAVAADASGNVVLAGVTDKLDLPTVNALQPKPALHPLFVTTDRGATWTALSFADPVTQVSALAIDPRRVSTLYAATDLGLYQSLDSGATWSLLYRDPAQAATALVLDPNNPDTLYLATNPRTAGPEGQPKLLKSADGGASFRPIMNGIIPDVFGAIPALGALAIDPANPSNLWLGAHGAMYRSTDAGEHWLRHPPGTGPLPPPMPIEQPGSFWGFGAASRILVDVAKPGRIYACCVNRPGSGLFLSSDGGVTWARGEPGPVAGSAGLFGPALDPRHGGVLFAPWYHGVVRSTDAGATWQEAAVPEQYVPDKFVDAAFDPNGTLYVLSDTGLVMRSADGARTWTAAYGPWSQGALVHAQFLAFRPGDPASFYVSSPFSTPSSSRKAFVSKLDREGRVVWSTYLGGSQSDEARAVGFDPGGDVWVAGTTSSKDFPASRNAIQPARARAATGDMRGTDAFLTRIAADGSRIVYSTFLGGPYDDEANALALDGLGNVYLAGTAGPGLPSGGLAAAGPSSAFAAKFDNTGRLIYADYLDGSRLPYGGKGAAIAVAPDGRASLTGCTEGAGLPLVNPLDAVIPGSFVATLDAAGKSTIFGSYFFPCWPSAPQQAPVIARSPSGSLWIAGPYAPNVTQIGQDFGAPQEGYLARIDFGLDAGTGPLIRSVRNAAGYQLGEVFAPGSLATIFGDNLARSTDAARSIPLPLELGAVSVIVGSTPAPLLYVSPSQINFQVPFEAPIGDMLLEYRIGGQTVHARQVRIVAMAPGFFTRSGDGRGPGLIVHASDFRPVTRENPAAPGEILVLYAAGLGRVEKHVFSGQAAPLEPDSLLNPGLFYLAVDSRSQTILYAGLAPGMVGVYQVNFVFDPAPGSGEKLVTFYGSNPVTVFGR